MVTLNPIVSPLKYRHTPRVPSQSQDAHVNAIKLCFKAPWMSGGRRNGLLSPLAERSASNAVPQSDLYTVRELLIGLKRNIKSGLGSIRNFWAFIDIRFQGRYNVVNVDEEVVIPRSPPPRWRVYLSVSRAFWIFSDLCISKGGTNRWWRGESRSTDSREETRVRQLRAGMRYC